jgi:hypothetical protein
MHAVVTQGLGKYNLGSISRVQCASARSNDDRAQTTSNNKSPQHCSSSLTHFLLPSRSRFQRVAVQLTLAYGRTKRGMLRLCRW